LVGLCDEERCIGGGRDECRRSPAEALTFMSCRDGFSLCGSARPPLVVVHRSSLSRLFKLHPAFVSVVYIVMHAIIPMLCISWFYSIPFFSGGTGVLLSRELACLE
jgi:hypothetical protein